MNMIFKQLLIYYTDSRDTSIDWLFDNELEMMIRRNKNDMVHKRK